MSNTYLSDEQCDEFRRYNGSFNDMVRFIYSAGQLIERERCANVCDAIFDEYWSRYKGTPPNEQHPARGNAYTEGVSDGGGLCADAIRRGE